MLTKTALENTLFPPAERRVDEEEALKRGKKKTVQALFTLKGRALYSKGLYSLSSVVLKTVKLIKSTKSDF